ncbi:hypothetical protein FW781_04875 (plasmid) [Chryseobacterium panacisoli]|uniref:Uncharacterized protein n=1 Tax=Chryseobacterium panacisoli TaxID=1807141 RepID=A0A5D8ZYP0_9FLAO|nr:hypothetical protein [Chryseobacterium panacisoli]TZF99262.1 hypothetical protein FW781_04875 [Chryseobacterium panacisoli]
MFYSFNYCFEQIFSEDQLRQSFTESIKEYQQLEAKFPDYIKGIVTDIEPIKIKTSKCGNLFDLILSLEREHKNYALRNFTKFPIENFYPDLDLGLVLSNNYEIKVNSNFYDGTSAKINHIYDGSLFSLALHEDLKKDQICIHENKVEKDYIDNLYGFVGNTEYNITSINKKISNSKKGFDKLLTLFEEPIFFQAFQDDYELLSGDCQKVVFDKLNIAKSRGLPTAFSADKDLIKDVTPDSEDKIKIFELRVFDPVALRLYFYEAGKKVYLASIRKKPPKKSQARDINTARSSIKELIKLGK